MSAAVRSLSHLLAWLFWLATAIAADTPADDAPTRDEAATALRRAAKFFRGKASFEGGYVWRYSADLTLRQGEGLAYDQRIWIQPPGTPAVGLALLDAFEATGESFYLQSAREAADALVGGQLYSGGWPYSVTFDPQKRLEHNYRVAPSRGQPDLPEQPQQPGGWAVWRQRALPGNRTILDDDTTTAALRLLMRVDQALRFEDASIHEAAHYGLASLVGSQYPIGAWSHNYDRFPREPPSRQYYPVRQASYPDSWSRQWTKDFSGCYVLNDRTTLNSIRTLLLAHEIYADDQYRDAALRGGRFLLLAQMPSPQRAWAQQYDRHMHPVWDRSFEPPAISALESQDVLETLLLLYQRTGQARFLEAVPPALAYLRRSQLPTGKLARFYELNTNKPIYFTKNYEITYDADAMPSHYQFLVNAQLEGIALRYRLLERDGPHADLPGPSPEERAVAARHAINTLDEQGAWTEPGWVRGPDARKVYPPGGILESQQFIENVQALASFLDEE